jgi:hypothetical protein
MYVRTGSLDAEEIRACSDGESAVITMLKVRIEFLGQTVKVACHAWWTFGPNSSTNAAQSGIFPLYSGYHLRMSSCS